MYKLAFAFFCVLCFAGCAATGPKFGTVEASIGEVSQDKSRIIFYRVYQAFGAGMRQEILVDGMVVGKSVPGGVFYIDVAPGSHKITIENQVYAGANNHNLNLEPGQTGYVRTWIGGSGFGGRTNMEIVPPDKARGQIAELAYTSGVE